VPFKKLRPKILALKTHLGYKYSMLYILLIDPLNCMEFGVLACAEIYQQSLGGEIYAVDLSGPVDSTTDQVTA
jgi:hypothetical protein